MTTDNKNLTPEEISKIQERIAKRDEKIASIKDKIKRQDDHLEWISNRKKKNLNLKNRWIRQNKKEKSFLKKILGDGASLNE